MKKRFLYGVILMLFTSSAYSGSIGFGLSGIYNFQTESFGAEFRLNFIPSNTFRIVPQVAYFPSFNNIHEVYGGLGLEINLFKLKRFNFYALGFGGYNGWINWEDSGMESAKKNNLSVQAGGGIVTNKGHVRPFVEYRYHFLWKETNLYIGVLFLFGNDDRRRYRNINKRRFSPVSCPAYN